MSDLKYVTDGKRHLICVPYSIENMHQMARELLIKKFWFQKNHYIIPESREVEIEKKCKKVSQAEIKEIIRSPQYGHIIISDLVPITGVKPSNQVLPEHEVLKYNGNSENRML